MSRLASRYVLKLPVKVTADHKDWHREATLQMSMPSRNSVTAIADNGSRIVLALGLARRMRCKEDG